MEQQKKLQRIWGSKNKIKLILIICLIASAAAAFYSYQAKKVTTSQRPDIKPAVDIVKIQRQDMLKNIELTGQTVPEAQVDVAAKYAGKIVQINVDLGQRVSPGDVLIVQDTNDVDASLAQNEAGLRQADADAVESSATFTASYQKAQFDYQHSVTNYQRYQALYAQGAVSKEALDNAEQQMTTAKSALDNWSMQLMAGSAASVESKRAARDKAQHAVNALQNQRNDLIIRAPRAGVIGYRQAEMGNMVQPGQKLLSIVDNSNIYVDCSVSEQDIGQIVLGLSTNISVESLGKTYTGKVIYISPAMDTKTQMFTIRIALDKPDDSLKTGMFARTNFSVLLKPQTLFVPKEAVVSLNGKDRVFVVNSNNQVEERIVQTGLRNDKSIEIVKGIQEGEQVAVTNISRLKTGMTITPNAISG